MSVSSRAVESGPGLLVRSGSVYGKGRIRFQFRVPVSGSLRNVYLRDLDSNPVFSYIGSEIRNSKYLLPVLLHRGLGLIRGEDLKQEQVQFKGAISSMKV